MKIIALSGLGNTGKSSILKDISDSLSMRWLKVETLIEIPRLVLDEVWNDNMYKFQERILSYEESREKDIKSLKNVDVVLVDRPRFNSIAYSVFNYTKGIMSNIPEINTIDIKYDLVVHLDTPIKETTTKWFKQYNDDIESLEFLLKFTAEMMCNNVEIFRNAKEDYHDIIGSCLSLIDD